MKESNFKANWDVDMGVTYVPWDDLPSVNVDALTVGGMIDNDSLPEYMKSKSSQRQIHTRTHICSHTNTISTDIFLSWWVSINGYYINYVRILHTLRCIAFRWQYTSLFYFGILKT